MIPKFRIQKCLTVGSNFPQTAKLTSAGRCEAVEAKRKHETGCLRIYHPQKTHKVNYTCSGGEGGDLGNIWRQDFELYRCSMVASQVSTIFFFGGKHCLRLQGV